MGCELSDPAGLKSTLRFRLGRAAVAAVGADDGLDEFVADDVALAEVSEVDALDGVERAHRLDEAGAFVRRQVDLGVVAGDDGL